MAARARQLAINPFGDAYPDDDSTKEILLQADGLETAHNKDRHVLLRWTNGVDATEKLVYFQIIQLSGGTGNYNFHTPQVHSETSQLQNKYYVLGQYTRAQRDQILALAYAVPFYKKSRINSCRTWTRLLLEAMVDANLLSATLFEHLDTDIPLKKPLPELSESEEA